MDRRTYLLRVFAGTFWALAFFALCIDSARAQSSGGSVRVSVIANAPQNFSSTGELLSHVTYEGRMAAASTGATPVAQTLYYQRAATFSKGTLAALARKRLKNMIPYVGQALLLKELLEDGGLFMDELMNINKTEAVPGANSTESDGTGWALYNDWSAGAANSCHPSMPAGWTLKGNTPGDLVGWSIYNSSWGKCTPVTHAHATSYGWVCSTYAQAGYSPTTQCVQALSFSSPIGTVYTGKPGAPAVAATDNEIADAMKNGAADKSLEWARKAWAEPFQWPNGQPIIANPMPAQMAEVASKYRTDTGVALAAGTSDPTYADETGLSTPTQSTAPSATSGTATNPATANASAAASVEFPLFCTWAEIVCDGIDWIRNGPPTDEPDPSEQPQEDLTPPVSGWVSGLGSGTCPAPKTYVVGPTSFSWSYTPFCDLAALIKPLVLLAASFMAALILAGIGKTSAA